MIQTKSFLLMVNPAPWTLKKGRDLICTKQQIVAEHFLIAVQRWTAVMPYSGAFLRLSAPIGDNAGPKSRLVMEMVVASILF